jgi:hypothetical protein
VFSLAENGWVAFTVFPAWVEEAKAYRESLAGRSDHVAYKDDLLWVGRVFEMTFHAWLLRDHAPHLTDHPFEMNCGVDGKPDFRVGDWGVGLKCRTVKKGRMHPDYAVNIPDKHMRREAEQALVFGALELPTSRMLILGGISRGRFLRDAKFVDKGERINPVTIADEAAWSIQAHELTPIEEMYAYITGQAA